MRVAKRILVLGLAALAACTHRNDERFAAASASAVAPAAVAPADFKVLVGTADVLLDGSKSWDPAGGPLTFLWEQTAGTPVALSDAASAAPSFDAPPDAGTLEFRLTVEGRQGTDADTVSVSVKTILVAAPDQWFVGYGKSGSITPTVAGGSGDLAFAWSGFQPWFNGTADASTGVLSFTTPLLTDFQSFRNAPGTMIPRAAAQGFQHLSVSVTDGTGASDEDLVSFSVGPFPDSMAGQNVAVGQPVFVNGESYGQTGEITSWSWYGTTPTDGDVTFYGPDRTEIANPSTQRAAYFVPDQPGVYWITLIEHPEDSVATFTVVADTFGGVGTLTGRTPDHNAGECGGCHSGYLSGMENLHEPWLQTAHASAYARVLDGGTWGDFTVDRRTIGWLASGGTAGGWLEKASAEGFVFQGTNWNEMRRKYPQTANLSNVQCESCHGPGRRHAGYPALIGKSYDAQLCGRCHAETYAFWKESMHVVDGMAGWAECNGCHTAQGFIAEMRAQRGASLFRVLTEGASPDRPELPRDQRHGETCQACHDPHRKTPGLEASAHDPQLRAYGNVMFRNGQVIWAGKSAVCFMCHQGQTDSRPGSPDTDARRCPSMGVDAEMLNGTGGQHVAGWTYTGSPHGDPAGFVVPGSTENRQCLTCHMDAPPGPGKRGYKALGGHATYLSEGADFTIAWDYWHGAGETVGGTNFFRVTANTTPMSRVVPGDLLYVNSGADVGTYRIARVDTNRQVTVEAAAPFAGGAVSNWWVRSVEKHHVAACTQCHPMAEDFRVQARGDYDGDGTIETVQDEIAGLRTMLSGVLNDKLIELLDDPGAYVDIGNNHVMYRTGDGYLLTFPGPASDNDQIAWASLSAERQADWLALYQAAFNSYFVELDQSNGLHNTGYAVNLLQSSCWAVTGTRVGQPFLPYP